MSDELTQAEAERLFHYDPETGNLIRRITVGSRSREGDVAGHHLHHGYRAVGINSVKYLVHRVVWLIIHGEFPPKEIDHINGDKSDNRLTNLRAVSRHENNRNLKLSKRNTSGVIGVSYDKRRNKWIARIQSEACTQKSLGEFQNKSDAIEARRLANIKYGYHANHGR